MYVVYPCLIYIKCIKNKVPPSQAHGYLTTLNNPCQSPIQGDRTPALGNKITKYTHKHTTQQRKGKYSREIREVF